MCLSRGSFFNLGGCGAMVPFCCSEDDPGGAPRLGRPTVSAVADVPPAAAVGLLGVALEFCAELEGHSVGLLQCCYNLTMALLHHFV
jgi:hypothetical protein